MVRKIYSDVDNLVAGVKTRVECLRMEALSTGKLSINENGFKASIDYGIPSTHKADKTWGSGDPTILEDMDAFVDRIVKDTGVHTNTGIDIQDQSEPNFTGPQDTLCNLRCEQ